MLKTLQNFYSATTSRAWAVGTGNRYVSTLPTPTSGYLVINPSNTTKREIVEYDGIGTDGNGNYITVTARGVGDTTNQTHTVGEPVRLNITAEYYADVQDEVDDLQGQIDTLVLQNAPNASTTTRGIVLLSTAAAEAGTAIVVATTDPKYTKIDSVPDHFVSVSTGANDAGSGVVLDASGVLDNSFIQQQIKARVYEYADSPATWTKPTGLTCLIVEAWGAGGGGGGAGGNDNLYLGGGGGGGCYSKKTILASSLGSTETITIGAGGTGGATGIGGDGTAGGNTTFGSHLTAYGGGGASGAEAASTSGGGGGGGGADGAGGSTTSNSAGSAGTGGVASVDAGAAGGAAGNAGNNAFLGGGGGSGGSGGGSSTSKGGKSYYGGGGGSSGYDTGNTGGRSIYGGKGGDGGSESSINGGVGSVPGGGGGGGCCSNLQSGGTAGTGGAGGAGRVIVYELY
jgi:hypothetical protein